MGDWGRRRDVGAWNEKRGTPGERGGGEGGVMSAYSGMFAYLSVGLDIRCVLHLQLSKDSVRLKHIKKCVCEVYTRMQN